MKTLSPDVQACINHCLDCYKICFSQAMIQRLPAGHEQTDLRHFTLMISCAEICRATAHVLLSGSAMHEASCTACAELCEACAISCVDCEVLEGMDDCVTTCSACAASCRALTAQAPAKLAA